MKFSKKRTPGEVEIIRLVDFIKSTGPSKASEVFPVGLLNDKGAYSSLHNFERELIVVVLQGPNRYVHAHLHFFRLDLLC